MTKIIYLMGAGRSGTTALAVFLGNNSKILSVGEMHQFFEHLLGEKKCSCGQSLTACEFWSPVLENLPVEFLEQSQEYRQLMNKIEKHTSILRHILKQFSEEELAKYVKTNDSVFATLETMYKRNYILDSAKYIGRLLALKNSRNLDIKVIYMVRDVRGVINSFSKQVQTPKKPISTIFYYLVVNLVAQFVYTFYLSGNAMKLRYEDLIENPIQEFDRIGSFLELDLSDIKQKIVLNEPFSVMHFIGGNRIRKNDKIFLRRDIAWQAKYSTARKILYYTLAAPIMLLNRYKIL